MEISNEEKNWAIFSHIGIFLGLIVPFGNILVPFIIWLMKREESDFVEVHSRESFNFQLSITIYFILLIFLFIIFTLISLPLSIILFIFVLISVIKASISASSKEKYKYSFKINFVRN